MSALDSPMDFVGFVMAITQEIFIWGERLMGTLKNAIFNTTYRDFVSLHFHLKPESE
jgi:hypothetical protein